jgi:hypothetical protein
LFKICFPSMTMMSWMVSSTMQPALSHCNRINCHTFRSLSIPLRLTLSCL